ncbi:hypothetical protein CCP3SC15_40016 [Gammaproteobacteria bacterium]
MPMTHRMPAGSDAEGDLGAVKWSVNLEPRENRDSHTEDAANIFRDRLRA